ncbi:hypothetical protein J2752_002384 [Halarchaeum rubridurum]|uniref:Uncharacterized protein n=2 Tax=Halarchaeum rubridurum TaxID=489911 RepID=A0A830G2Y3_9EURY|nr:hypothetical protein [Halarchaeum rubridurum]MBP1955461.1 hypothetical protein [Halarchaeum rubridurum]GGM72541.1 hypothetical protein GCM10009017_23140 [Halarchaeum rubridurum]
MSSLPFDWSPSGESEVGFRGYGTRVRRLVGRSVVLAAGVVAFGLSVGLTFVAYLTGAVAAGRTRLLFALYVVLATVWYALTLVWGNVEQRRTRRADAAPEIVLETRGGAVVASNVGAGPAIDARIAVAVDGERVYDELRPVLRSGEHLTVVPGGVDDDATVDLGVWSATRLADVEYRVERTYEAATLRT